MPRNAKTVTEYSGMGALPRANGVTFRVWAPHAEQVYVTGTFNDWGKDSAPLVNEKNGYWSTDVPDAKVGDEYRYVIHPPPDWNLPPLSRLHPYTRKVTTSIGNGVIYDPRAFDWGDDTFHMASGNDLVIYEMHVGTFYVKEEGRPGTLDSAVEKLPYLQKLGINAVEVMPVAAISGDFRGATIRLILLQSRIFTAGRMHSSDS